MLKGNVRREYLQKRMSLSESERNENALLIRDRFSGLDIPGKRLLSYCALSEQSEFDISLVEEVFLQQSPMAVLAWPRIAETSKDMEAVILKKGALFIKNRYGILEPIAGELLSPTDIDIVFVPLIACDVRGYRVGYGKGYYDRYLSRCRNDLVKVGFSYFEPVDSLDDIHEFDVPLNLCITPTRIYEF